MTWVWATAEHGERVVLDIRVPSGHVAYVHGGTEAHLWGRLYPWSADTAHSAAAEFIGTASACAAEASAGRTCRVVGEGLLAELIRSLLPQAPDRAPDTIVDTTGIPERILSAVHDLPRLGRLVLAAPPFTRDVDLDTYADLHVRGLSVVGIAWRATTPRLGDEHPPVEDALANAVVAESMSPCARAPLYIVRLADGT
jgi:hypothetical protein